MPRGMLVGWRREGECEGGTGRGREGEREEEAEGGVLATCGGTHENRIYTYFYLCTKVLCVCVWIWTHHRVSGVMYHSTRYNVMYSTSVNKHEKHTVHTPVGVRCEMRDGGGVLGPIGGDSLAATVCPLPLLLLLW